MFSAENIKQYVVGTVLPILAGSLATVILVHVHFLALFHVTAGTLAHGLVELGTFGVVAALSWLKLHHILKGTYQPKPAPFSGTTGFTVEKTGSVGQTIPNKPKP